MIIRIIRVDGDVSVWSRPNNVDINSNTDQRRFLVEGNQHLIFSVFLYKAKAQHLFSYVTWLLYIDR